MLKYILLGFIWHKPSTGYELKQMLDSSTGYFWHAYHSQIYTTLRNLEEEGLISTRVENGSDHLNRRICEITPKGKQALVAWQNEPLTEMTRTKEDLLVRLFFAGVRSIPEIAAELRLQRKLHLQQLEEYRSLNHNELPINGNHQDMDPELTQDLREATLQFGIKYEEMYLGWLDQLIQKLESQKQPTRGEIPVESTPAAI